MNEQRYNCKLNDGQLRSANKCLEEKEKMEENGKRMGKKYFPANWTIYNLIRKVFWSASYRHTLHQVVDNTWVLFGKLIWTEIRSTNTTNR